MLGMLWSNFLILSFLGGGDYFEHIDKEVIQIEHKERKNGKKVCIFLLLVHVALLITV